MGFFTNTGALKEGEIIFDGLPIDLFSSLDENIALEIPPLYRFISSLNKTGVSEVRAKEGCPLNDILIS